MEEIHYKIATNFFLKMQSKGYRSYQPEKDVCQFLSSKLFPRVAIELNHQGNALQTSPSYLMPTRIYLVY